MDKNKKYQIFISSTSKDMSEVRMQLIESLFQSTKYFPIAMEHFLACPSIIDMLYENISNSSVYILLVKSNADTCISSCGNGRNEACLEKIMNNNVRVKEEIYRLVTSLKEMYGSFSISDLTFTQVEFAFAKSLQIPMLGYVYDDKISENLEKRRSLISGSDDGIAYGSWSDGKELCIYVNQSFEYFAS